MKRMRTSAPVVAFWDTSAIVPLCCYQANSSRARQIARDLARQVVWWGTPVEATSALRRLLRDRLLSGEEGAQFAARLDYLRSHWSEVQPSDEVRELAERLLGLHNLRAADALQLAAALVWCSNRPRGRCFVAADSVLLTAAEMQGFTVQYI